MALSRTVNPIFHGQHHIRITNQFSPKKVSVISTANSIQCYVSSDYARQLYAGNSDNSEPDNHNSHNNYSSPIRNNNSGNNARDNSPATPLSGRTFGTWTFLSAVIRMYAAYHIYDPLIYDLAQWTYGIALAHFLSEWLIFRTAKAEGRFLGPLIVASTSLAWMALQKVWYTT